MIIEIKKVIMIIDLISLEKQKNLIIGNWPYVILDEKRMELLVFTLHF